MLTHKTSGKRRRHANESGQAAVFLVLAMGIFLIGSMGFVVDGTNLWFHRQAAQTAADAACTAGAMDMLSVAAGADAQNWIGQSFDCSGKTDGSPNSGFPPCQYAGFNGYNGSGLSASQAGTNVNVSPATFSGITNDCDYSHLICSVHDLGVSSPFLQVTVTDRVSTTFMHMIPGVGQTVDVKALAKCGLSNMLSAVPVLVLNPNADDVLTAGHPATLAITNGPLRSVQVNSVQSDAVDLSNLTIDLTNANDRNGGDFAVAGRQTKPANVSSNWVNAAGVISDPFASIEAPSVPPAAPASDFACPESLGISPGHCAHYYPGYYGADISIGATTGPSTVAVFEPGLYYLDANLVAGPNSCLRSNTSVNTEGVVFYFHGTSTLLVSQNSGTASGGGGFNCQTTPVPISAIRCKPGGPNLLLNNLPSAGLTGNVLLAPCEGTYTDVKGNPQPLGDPLGTADPAGEQRGVLFFHDRDSAPAPQPIWRAANSFGLVGNLYFHYCKSQSGGTGSGANCRSTAFSDVFRIGSGSPAYVVGDIVVDQLRLGEPDLTSFITVTVNPYAQYYVLKASLLQ